MRLDRRKIEAELIAPSKSRQIELALEQQERIKFHTDTSLEVSRTASYTRFKTFISSILPQDKVDNTLNLLKFPLPTNEITDKVFVKLSKIFDGRNPAFNYQFKNTQERDDWEWYRQEVLNEPQVWSNKAWDFFKTEINCVMIVDMPSIPDATDKYPQPYFYFVPIGSVVSYKVNDITGNMDWIIFHSDDKIIAIDGESYKTYEHKDKKLGKRLSESPHGLPYCPARFFWTEPLTLSNPDIKKSPLSKELSNLDWYLFKLLGKRHLETYASYPIYSGFEEECDFMDKDGNSCRGGHLVGADGNWITDLYGNPTPCPLCRGKKQLAGAGSFITVPIPSADQPDLRKPIDILTIDKDSLDYNREEVKRLEEQIISACVGVDNTILNEVSVTDKQVDASYESQDSVLNRIKKGFEVAQEFVDKTCCLLRYGETFLSAKINYGTEFYTLTPEVLRKRYSQAKSGGATESELDALREQMIETEFRHNPIVLQRMLILSDLEPFVHSTKGEVLNYYQQGLVSAEDFTLKSDFSTFIRRFERENDNIIEFGSAMPYNEKIKTIYQTLLNYAKERKQNPNAS